MLQYRPLALLRESQLADEFGCSRTPVREAIKRLEFEGLVVSKNGADIILVPTALGSQWGWVAQQMMPTPGDENGVYFVYANYCGEENQQAYPRLGI